MQIKLIYGGKPLVDDHTLEQSKVKAGDTINMVLQLRWSSNDSALYFVIIKNFQNKFPEN